MTSGKAANRTSSPIDIEVIEVRKHRRKRGQAKNRNPYDNVTTVAGGESPRDSDGERRHRRGVLGRFRQSDKKNGSPGSPKSPRSRFFAEKKVKLKDRALPLPTPATAVDAEPEADTDSRIYETMHDYEPIKFRASLTVESETKSKGKPSPPARQKDSPYRETAKEKTSTDSNAQANVSIVKSIVDNCNTNGQLTVNTGTEGGGVRRKSFSGLNAERNYNYTKRSQTNLRRDLPKTRGIVKNGIMKFEANSNSAST